MSDRGKYLFWDEKRLDYEEEWTVYCVYPRAISYASSTFGVVEYIPQWWEFA